MSEKLPITQAALKGLADLWVDYRGKKKKKREKEKGSNRAERHQASKRFASARSESREEDTCVGGRGRRHGLYNSSRR